MKLDENEFFRQATLRICSSLDVEKALLNCIDYFRLHMPVSEISLGLLEPHAAVMRSLAWVGLDGARKSFPPIPVDRETVERLEAREKHRREVWLAEGEELDFVERLLRPYLDFKNRSVLLMTLAVEGQRLGTLGIIAEGKGRFDADHVHLISLLREPFSIAMSNALRYEEVVKLKEIVDAENRELSRELRQFSGESIIGAEYGLRGVMELVRQVAPLNSPVMLLGETGVGKEILANAIHHSSPRRGGPLVKVNCGAIPESLIDSELFGHEKGAFTGAIGQKRGRFERADRGSIFLDEIGELPPQAQVRLLRVLQHKEIERVGGTKTIPVDVRIMAATHRSVEEMIRAGTFREDLWFRLNIFPIVIPPLRHRKEDISAMVHHFLVQKSKELKIYPPPPISAEGIERLKAHHWPGNVRELENLVERELILSRGRPGSGPLAFEHFDLPKRAPARGGVLDAAGEPIPLDEAMSRHIRQALRRTGGRIYGPSGAAVLLGINPNTLRSRMRKLGIPFGRREG